MVIAHHSGALTQQRTRPPASCMLTQRHQGRTRMRTACMRVSCERLPATLTCPPPPPHKTLWNPPSLERAQCNSHQDSRICISYNSRRLRLP